MTTYIQSEGGTEPAAPYLSAPPTHCDICQAKIVDCFIDGRTARGPWANMCPACHAHYGVGLGMGRGQKYCRKAGPPTHPPRDGGTQPRSTLDDLI